MKFTKEEMSNALDEAYKKAGDNAYFANGFAFGVEFALQQVKSVDLADVVGQSEQFICGAERVHGEERCDKQCGICLEEYGTSK